MAKVRNISKSKRFEVTLSRQSVEILHGLAARGPYGRNPHEVGGRLLEEALRTFIVAPKFRLEPNGEVTEIGPGDDEQNSA